MKPALFSFNFRRGSVRTRLMIWNVGTLALILIALGGIIQYTVRKNLFLSVDRDLDARGVPMMGMRPHGGVPGGGGPHGPPPPNDGLDPGGLQRLRSLLEDNSPRRWPPPPEGFQDRPPRRIQDRARTAYTPRMLNRDGKSLFPDSQEPWDKAAFLAALQGQEPHTTVVADEEPLRILSKPMRHGSEIIGVIQIPYPLTDIQRAIAGMNSALLTLIPVALLLAGLGGALLTDRALRPVQQIAQTTEQIGAKELSQRLAVAGDDEFSQLAATINGMLARLETAFAHEKSLVRQLEKLIEQERRFTADASHELKTPLTIVKANTSLLMRGQPSLEDYRESIEDIDRAADTMRLLVHDLLLLARYDAGQLGRNMARLTLSDILEQARQNIRNAKAAPITLELPSEALDFLGNKEEILRLFSNLLENAARYTPPDGEIRVTAQREVGNVVVRVADTGSGIAPEHLAHLGERFYRVDAARARPDGGTGLGLSICKSIVEAHGGAMTFASVVGKGTTVTVTLPRAN